MSICFNAKAKQAKNQELPTIITSKIMDVKRKDQIINFYKNVMVEKGDDVMLAEKMTVLYHKVNEQKTTIKQIDAEKNVRIFSEEFVGSGEFGHYDPNKEIFVLTKNVIINNGTSIANGDKFIYNLLTKKGNFVGKSKKTQIEGKSDNRVIVVIGEGLKKDKKKDKKTENTNEQKTDRKKP